MGMILSLGNHFPHFFEQELVTFLGQQVLGQTESDDKDKGDYGDHRVVKVEFGFEDIEDPFQPKTNEYERRKEKADQIPFIQKPGFEGDQIDQNQ